MSTSLENSYKEASSGASREFNQNDLLLADVERRHILEVLEHYKGNKTRAAKAMGITVKTLYNKLNLYRKQGLVN